MDVAPKKTRSRKEKMQLDRARWLDALYRAAAAPHTALTPVTFFVVWVLVTRFHNDEKGAFPSHQTLAAATGLGVKAVRVHLDLTVAAGFLIKRRVGNMQPNVYLMDFDVMKSGAVENDAAFVPPRPWRRESVAFLCLPTSGPS